MIITNLRVSLHVRVHVFVSVYRGRLARFLRRTLFQDFKVVWMFFFEFFHCYFINCSFFPPFFSIFVLKVNRSLLVVVCGGHETALNHGDLETLLELVCKLSWKRSCVRRWNKSGVKVTKLHTGIGFRRVRGIVPYCLMNHKEGCHLIKKYLFCGNWAT